MQSSTTHLIARRVGLRGWDVVNGGFDVEEWRKVLVGPGWSRGGVGRVGILASRISLTIQ